MPEISSAIPIKCSTENLIGGREFVKSLFYFDLNTTTTSDSFQNSINLLSSPEVALSLVREVLRNVTGNKLNVCECENQLPVPLTFCTELPVVSPEDLRRVRQAVRAVAENLDFSVERSYDLIASVSEGAMNTIVHAGGGVATIYCDSENKEIQVWIRDHGKGISAPYLHRATLECGFTTANSMGCGFFIILNTVDSLSLLTNATGTTIVLSQKREKSTNSSIEIISQIFSED